MHMQTWALFKLRQPKSWIKVNDTVYTDCGSVAKRLKDERKAMLQKWVSAVYCRGCSSCVAMSTMQYMKTRPSEAVVPLAAA